MLVLVVLGVELEGLFPCLEFGPSEVSNSVGYQTEIRLDFPNKIDGERFFRLKSDYGELILLEVVFVDALDKLRSWVCHGDYL